MNDVNKPTMLDYNHHVLVCVGKKCTEHGEGHALYDELKVKLRNAGLDSGALRVIRSATRCLGTCKSGPLVCVQPDGIWYYNIDSEKLDRIIEDHLIGGHPVKEWIYFAKKG
jgi:(2Fe-2S) ferredoxin